MPFPSNKKGPGWGLCSFVVREVGFEPTHLSIAVFETAASAIPPLARALGLCHRMLIRIALKSLSGMQL